MPLPIPVKPFWSSGGFGGWTGVQGERGRNIIAVRKKGSDPAAQDRRNQSRGGGFAFTPMGLSSGLQAQGALPPGAALENNNWASHCTELTPRHRAGQAPAPGICSRAASGQKTMLAARCTGLKESAELPGHCVVRLFTQNGGAERLGSVLTPGTGSSAGTEGTRVWCSAEQMDPRVRACECLGGHKTP